MPEAVKRLEDALARSFEKRKKAGKLKGVDRGAYVWGSDTMKKLRGKS